LLLLLLSLALLAAPAPAKLCGDNVGGVDVPCACSDTVVSDLVLTDDPVVNTVCPHDGLIVRVNQAPHGVTIDLQGKTLRGAQRGTGVWIIDGGPGGARLISSGGPATIEGFRDGIAGRGPDSVQLIEGINAVRNARDGVRIDARNYTVRNITALTSGRDGFALGGAGFHATDTRAYSSKRFGFFVTGLGGALGASGAPDIADGSGDIGFNVTGMGHSLVDCTAMRGGKAGFRLNGMHFTITHNTANLNGGDGFNGMGGDWYLTGNRAINNGDDGLKVQGGLIVDGGGNRGSGNLGFHWRTATQCAINDVPCAQ